MTSQTNVAYTTIFTCNERWCETAVQFPQAKIAALALAKEAGWTLGRDDNQYCPEHPRKRGRRSVQALAASA
jgi:hypothetical protein